MYCRYRERKVIAGNYMDVSIYPVFAAHKGVRQKAFRPTSEVQKALNKKNSFKQLTYLLNTNFTDEDIRLDLTFRDECLPTTENEAWNCVNNFFRRIKRRLKRDNMQELKYIAVLDAGRPHFHIVCNLGAFNARTLRDIWGYGFIGVENLEFGQFGLEGLARYMLKSPVGVRAWRASRNLKQPIRREVTGRLSGKQVKELSSLADAAEPFERLYPGYSFAGSEPFFNDYNGCQYITVRLYRTPEYPEIQKNAKKRVLRRARPAQACIREVKE